MSLLFVRPLGAAHWQHVLVAQGESPVFRSKKRARAERAGGPAPGAGRPMLCPAAQAGLLPGQGLVWSEIPKVA